MPNASLLAIGNELLNGNVRDLNLFTLSRELTHLGFVVGPALLLRDVPSAIAAGVKFVLNAQPDVIICSGGLGPTEDDLTLSALATALNCPLHLDTVARELVEAHYARLLAQHYLTQIGPAAARQKMATLPRGATPLPNPVGTAPGVRLMCSATLIYVLPGVPAELEAIFAESVVPDLRQHFDLGAWAEDSLLVHCDDEADLAPWLREVTQRHPQVYLKSLAQPFPAAAQEGLRVIAAVCLENVAASQHAVAQTLNDLQHTVTMHGVRVTMVQCEK